MKTIKCIFIAAVALITAKAYSQITQPQIIPTSPSAAALQKYTDYPVNLSTGLLDISIPIYTIKSDDISVPIELKYHASGIRYDDATGNIGIGWTLFAGGMVTGIQMGIPDNSTNNFFKAVADIDPYDNGTTIYNDNHGLIDVVNEIKDSEYDIFNYSFLNYSGKFSFPGTTEAVLTPKRNFKVSVSGPSGGGMFSKYPVTIVDDDGISYTFGNNGAVEMPFGNTKTANYMLSEIVSADKSDTVRFTYSGVTTYPPGTAKLFQRLIIDDYVIWYDNWTSSIGNPGINSPVTSGTHYYDGYTYCRLDKITFKTGKLIFDHDSNNLLTKVSVYNNTDSAPVKTAVLTQSTYGEDYYKLDQVDFKDATNTQTYNYKLNYNGIPYKKLSGFDYWGYYNGTPEPLSYVPNFKTYIDGALTNVGPANREPDETAMKQGILNKITYPTGGYSIFTYEAHRYIPSGDIAGGLRIKSIANYDASGNPLGQKWYKYGIGERGKGNLYKAIDPADYCYTYLYAKEDPNPYVVYFDYTYQERTFLPFPAFSNLGSGSSVTYDYVTEYTGDGVNDNGKTVYSYSSDYDQFYGPYVNGRIPLVYRSQSWKAGLLYGKDIYKKISGTYVPVSSLQNNYVSLHEQDYHCLKVVRWLDWPSVGYLNANGLSQDEIKEMFDSNTAFPVNYLIYNQGFVSPYSYADYLLSTGISVLDHSIEITDGVTRTTTYTYDGTYDKPRTVTTTQSDGNTRITQYTYPFDKTSAPYPAMVTRNIIEPVIEQDEYKNSTANFLQSTITDYFSWSGDVIKPVTVSTKTGSAAAEARLHYWGYDNLGNLKAVSMQDGPATMYIWSYNGAYPVAEIKNADTTTVIAALGGRSAIATFRNSNPSNATVASFLAPLRTGTFNNALVSTFTYDPLVGQTSATDPKGDTTYYEYDNFKRLMNIKDKDGNIIKHIDYNYAH